MMKKLSYLAVILLVGMWSCQWETIIPKEIDLPDEPVSFSVDIAPVFAEKCASCHGGGISPDLRADKSYSELTSKGLVDTENPADSELMEKIYADHGAPLSATQQAMILKWIEEGALNN